MTLVKIAEQEIAYKIGTQYISSQLPLLENVDITFLYPLVEKKEDEWLDDKGRRQFIIRFPYEVVQQSEDVRALIVAKAKERGCGVGIPM